MNKLVASLGRESVGQLLGSLYSLMSVAATGLGYFESFGTPYRNMFDCSFTIATRFNEISAISFAQVKRH